LGTPKRSALDSNKIEQQPLLQRPRPQRQIPGGHLLGWRVSMLQLSIPQWQWSWPLEQKKSRMTSVVAIREFVHLGHRVEGLPRGDRQASVLAKKPHSPAAESVAARESARDD
jgi:hypothetical protein